MRISTRVRYGLRALVDLAACSDGRPEDASNIARRQDISKKYLDQLMATLRSAGIVKSSRGPRGGYVLARPADSITVEDVIVAFDGPISMVDCVKSPDSCPRSPECATIGFWRQVTEAVESTARNTTIAKLARQA